MNPPSRARSFTITSAKKKSALEEAYKFILAHFFTIRKDRANGLRERMKQVLGDVHKMPYLFVLYFLQKNQDTRIQSYDSGR